MNPLYNRKLQQALIDTGKKVEQKKNEETQNLNELKFLFDALSVSIEIGNMRAQSVTSSELIAAIMKWRLEKV